MKNIKASVGEIPMWDGDLSVGWRQGDPHVGMEMAIYLWGGDREGDPQGDPSRYTVKNFFNS